MSRPYDTPDGRIDLRQPPAWLADIDWSIGDRVPLGWRYDRSHNDIDRPHDIVIVFYRDARGMGRLTFDLDGWVTRDGSVHPMP